MGINNAVSIIESMPVGWRGGGGGGVEKGTCMNESLEIPTTQGSVINMVKVL